MRNASAAWPAIVSEFVPRGLRICHRFTLAAFPDEVWRKPCVTGIA